MSGFGKDDPEAVLEYWKLVMHYLNCMNMGGINKKFTDDKRYLAMLYLFWEEIRDKTQAYDDYMHAIIERNYHRSDWLFRKWASADPAKWNFFGFYPPYADAYNMFITEKIKAGMPVYRIMNIDEALNIAYTGIFDARWDHLPDEANTKPFFFVPDQSLEMPDTVTLAMPATAMPFQMIRATPYLRFDRTIKSGQTILYTDLELQEVRLDLADPMTKNIPDDVRPTLTVKKHINLTARNMGILERRFDVRVI